MQLQLEIIVDLGMRTYQRSKFTTSMVLGCDLEKCLVETGVASLCDNFRSLVGIEDKVVLQV
jgi:hypothetical protein